MSSINKLLLVVVLVAVFIFGLFTAVYTFAGRDQYSEWGLPAVLALPEDAEPIREWVGYFERGSVPVLSFAIVILAGLAGLLFLVMELLPGRRRHLRLDKDRRVERKVVEIEAERVALEGEGVLDAVAEVKPRRRKGSKLVLNVTARRGEDPGQVEQIVGDRVRSAILEKGQIDFARLRVKAHIKDPRQAKRRVR